MALPRRLIYLVCLYGSIAALSYWGAWLLRFGFYPDLSGIPENFATVWWQQGLYLLPLKLAFLYAFGVFDGFLRFFRFPDAVRLVLASGLFSFVCLLVWYASGTNLVPPALVLAADFLIFTFLSTGLRVSIRLVDEWQQGQRRKSGEAARIGIIGVGEVGSSLAADLLSQPRQGMRPVAFFDDNPAHQGRSLHGVPVVGTPEAIPEMIESYRLDKMVLAMPSALPERVREISVLLKKAHIPLDTVPTLGQLLRGAHTTDLREVKIEDLLYREPIEIDPKALAELVRGKCVWVTGAGGSIGGELSRQIAGFGPDQLVLIDASEGALFQTERQLGDDEGRPPVRPVVVDLRQTKRIDELMQEVPPNLFFHAAAHKHVGMMERQPREAFANNTLATLMLARLAVQHGVERFCLISTDKAVEPTNVMGASKRLAEIVLQALADADEAGKTAFSIVRFGNVIGSSGSVIPIFEQQIAEGRPVTVTDREMTRFFMTIAEAVGLVLQATAFPSTATLFTLDMGAPVSIDAMARDLIRLKGLEPDLDVPIVYTGVRPGEKLHEALHYPSEKLEATTHPKIHRVQHAPGDPGQAKAFLEAIDALAGRLSLPRDDRFRDELFNLLGRNNFLLNKTPPGTA